MDVGIFISSGLRLKVWLILPALMIVTLGLGSHAWQRQSAWKLSEAQSLSEVLPELIATRNAANGVFNDLTSDSGSDQSTEDRLISFLQDVAQQHDLVSVTVNMVDLNRASKGIPSMIAVMRGKGDFASVQLYINEVKSRQQLISVDGIRVMRPEGERDMSLYDVEIIFRLLQLGEIRETAGGI